MRVHRKEFAWRLHDDSPEPLDARHLLHFATIVDRGGITKAAVALGASISSLTRSIADLESQFCTKLLIRQGQGMALTDAGSRLHSHTVGILASVRSAIAEVREVATHPTTMVNLAMPPTTSALLAAPVALRFLAELPSAKLRFSDGFSGHIREWLSTGRVDVGLLYSTSSVLGEQLWKEDMYLIGHPDYLSGSGRECRFRDLGDMPLILPSPQHGLRQLIDRHAQKHGVALRIAAEVDSLATIIDLVELQLGLTILPMAALSRCGQRGLKQVQIVEPRVWRTIVLASSPTKAISDASRALIDIIRSEAEAIREGRGSKFGILDRA